MILKAICWETISTLVMFLLAWIVFGNVTVCIAFSVIAFLIKVVLFVVHETLWERFK